MRVVVRVIFGAVLLAACAQQPTPVTMADVRQRVREMQEEFVDRRERAIVECMSASGFTYAPSVGEVVVEAHYGYASALRTALSQPPDIAPTDAVVTDVLPPDDSSYNLVLTGSETGDGEGGCREWARNSVGTDFLPLDVIERAEAAHRTMTEGEGFKDALDAWSRCLATRFHVDFDGVTPERVESVLDAQLLAALAEHGAVLDDDPLSALVQLAPMAAQAVVSELATFEAELYQADSDCQERSGLHNLYAVYATSFLDMLPEVPKAEH